MKYKSSNKNLIGIIMIIGLILFSMSGCDEFWPPSEWNDPGSGLEGEDAGDGLPGDDGAGETDDTDDGGTTIIIIEPAFPEFSLSLSEGDYWKFGVKKSWSTDFGGTTGSTTGGFILSLGESEDINGITAYRVEIYEQDCDDDVLPRWQYLAESDGVFYGSEDGLSLTVLFDSILGIWPGSGFFGSLDSSVLYTVVGSQIDNLFITSPALEVSDSVSEDDNMYVPGIGTIYGGGATINISFKEYYSLETGILGYYDFSSYYDYYYQRSDKLEIGLVESSLSGGTWTPLASPAEVTAAKGEARDSIPVEWSPAPGAESYRVYYYTDEEPFLLAEVSGGSSDLYVVGSGEIPGIAPGEAYTFTVVSVNGFGEESIPLSSSEGWIMDRPEDFSLTFTVPVAESSPASGPPPYTLASLQLGPELTGGKSHKSLEAVFAFEETGWDDLYMEVISGGLIDAARQDAITDGESYLDIIMDSGSYRINCSQADTEVSSAVESLLDLMNVLVPVPEAPIIVSGVESSDFFTGNPTISLSWEAVAFADSYQVYYGSESEQDEPLLLGTTSSPQGGVCYFLPGVENFFSISTIDVFGLVGERGTVYSIIPESGFMEFLAGPELFYDFAVNQTEFHGTRNHKLLYSDEPSGARQIELIKNTGSPEMAFGMTFAFWDSSNYHALQLKQDGTYSIIRVVEEAIEYLTDWTAHPVINTAAGGVNTVEAGWHGPYSFSTPRYKYVFKINGIELSAIAGFEEQPSLAVGIFVDVGNEEEEGFPSIPVFVRARGTVPEVRPDSAGYIFSSSFIF